MRRVAAWCLVAALLAVLAAASAQGSSTNDMNDMNDMNDTTDMGGSGAMCDMNDMNDMGDMNGMDGMNDAMTPALLALSQSSSTYTLRLASVTLAQDGFVVVHAFDAAGDLVITPPLGVIYLGAGTYEDVPIVLDRGLLAEYGYGAAAKDVLPMLHVDANDDFIYQFPTGPDAPVTVAQRPVVATVSYTLSPQ